MKTKLITLLVLAFFTSTYAQFGSQQIITTNADYAQSVYAEDIDGDGDIDVLSNSSGVGIAWYENLDGLGDFGPQQVFGAGYSTQTADFEGDGDIDVFAILPVHGSNFSITWYENDGDGNFTSWQSLLYFQFASGVSLIVEDLDGDGDIDLLFSYSQKFVWYENDGFGNFGFQQLIANLSFPSVYYEDLDGDGDMDILASRSNSIRWYENTDGQGSFDSGHLIPMDLIDVIKVYAKDLDGDGDIDVLAASWDDDTIAWFENTDGLGNFGTQQIITTNAYEVQSVYATDLDSDGDIDVLSASELDDKVAWYENDGAGNFGSQQIITTNALGARDVYAEDLDGDGDMDVLSASLYDDKIAWYENLHPLGVSENALADVFVYPIPTKGMLTIESKTVITEIEVYNQLGQLVLSNSNNNKIDLSSVSQGIYIVKIKDVNGNIGTQKVVKK